MQVLMHHNPSLPGGSICKEIRVQIDGILECPRFDAGQRSERVRGNVRIQVVLDVLNLEVERLERKPLANRTHRRRKRVRANARI
jgi:hypothetical protein